MGRITARRRQNPWGRGGGPSQADIEDMIRRDRNHPSIILWSIGNEEHTIQWSIAGERIGATLRRVAHRLDPTRGLRPDMLTGILFSADRAAWLAYYGQILRRAEGETQFRQVYAENDGNLRLTLDPSGRVWVLGKSQARPLSGRGGAFPSAIARAPTP